MEFLNTSRPLKISLKSGTYLRLANPCRVLLQVPGSLETNNNNNIGRYNNHVPNCFNLQFVGPDSFIERDFVMP